MHANTDLVPRLGHNKKCVVYARVSTEDQVRKGFSLQDQVEVCCRRARELGYPEEATTVLRDEGFSGDQVNRPGLNRLRELVALAGEIGHVIIYDPDRFARSLSLQLVVTDEIVKGGAVPEFINFEWKDTPEGRLFYSLRGAIAEYEKAKIKERTRRGREQKAKQGLMPVGRSPYGFRFNPDTDLLEPNDDEIAVIRLMKDLLLTGDPVTRRPLSAVKIAAWLVQHGIPAPKGKKWYPSTITKILKSESYTGTYWAFKTDSTTGKRRPRPRAEQYPIKILALWDEATRQQILQRLASNRWLKSGRRSQGNYLLKGLIYCGVCSAGTIRMRGNSVVDQRRNYQYYICYRHHGRAAFDLETGQKVHCPSRHWPAQKLDAAVWRDIKGVLKNPAEMLAKYNALVQSDQERRRFEQELSTLDRALAQKEAECDRYLRLFALGHIDNEGKLAAMLTPARRELEQLRQRREEAASLLQQAAVSGRQRQQLMLTVAALREAVDAVADDDFDGKRAIVTHLVRRVVTYSDSYEVCGLFRVPVAPGPVAGCDRPRRSDAAAGGTRDRPRRSDAAARGPGPGSAGAVHANSVTNGQLVRRG